MKLQLYDSALALLRALSHSGAEALLCVGEALGPALVLLHRSLRHDAYAARRVTGAEFERPEGAYSHLQYVLLCAPCMHPPYVGLRGVKKALGE